MNKKGVSLDLSLIVGLIIVLLIGWAIIAVVIPGIFNFGEGQKTCLGYCTDVCGAASEVSSMPVPGQQVNAWCQKGIYDLSEELGEGEDKKPLAHWFTRFDKANSNTDRVQGSDIGLQCCSVLPGNSKEIPPTFLGSNLRVDEVDGKDIAVIRVPHIRTYFGAQTSPIRNEGTIEVISNKKYEVRFEVERVKEFGSRNGAVKRTDNDDDEENDLTCRIKILDGLEEIQGDFEELRKICEQFNEKTLNGKTINNTYLAALNITIPAKYERSSFSIELLITADPGRYVSRTSDVRFKINLNVINPVQIKGLSDRYVQEKTLDVSCKDIECKNFSYRLYSTTDKEITCTAASFSNNKVKQASMSAKNKGLITINQEGEYYVCVRGTSVSGRNYYNLGSVPVRIDREPPEVIAKFKTGLNVFQGALSMHTNASCFDEKSGCVSAVGFFYIDQPVDFIFALVSGASNAQRDCPAERAKYSFQRAQAIRGGHFEDSIDSDFFEMNAILPYYGTDTLRVLCVMVEDNAGNFNRDILLNYNSWDVVQAIAIDQRDNGGYGTGYTGYLY